MRRILWIAAVVLIVLAALHEFSMRPVTRGDGVLAPDAPQQTDLSQPHPLLYMKDAP